MKCLLDSFRSSTELLSPGDNGEGESRVSSNDWFHHLCRTVLYQHRICYLFFPAEKKGLRSRCSNEGKKESRGRVEETPCKGLSAGKGFCRARRGGRGREEKLNA